MRHRYHYLAACLAAAMVTACQAGTASNAPAAPTTTSASVAQVDWRNTTYKLRCESDSSQPPVTVTVRGGKGSAPGHQVQALQAAVGDLTGDGQPETAVLVSCEPVGTNYTTEEIVVLGDGSTALGNLPADGSLNSPNAFTGTTLAIANGRLTAEADTLAAGQCRACGPPSVHVSYEWRWSNGTLVGGQR